MKIISKIVYRSVSKETFAEHFEKLNNSASEHVIVTDTEMNNNAENGVLDDRITEEEVEKCIRCLKNNKASGQDGILNEFLKHSGKDMVTIITKLFNVVLNSGKMPNTWTTGYICPIFKGKGSTLDPDNYRGITIVSCFGKLFSSVLNRRITTFLEVNNLLGQEQSGFRKGHSTLDHIFTLHCLIDAYLSRKKKLYCTFVDFRKAYDSIQRAYLWEKILNMGISGKVLNIIKDMYDKTKLCVKHLNSYSQYFVSNLGLLQGENLSPILFSMFLNDLKATILSSNNIKLNNLADVADIMGAEQLELYMYMFLLLYADDTAILAENATDMQNALTSLEQYCNRWGLHTCKCGQN